MFLATILYRHSYSRTLISALHVWLDSYPDDFREPGHHPTLTQLLQFCGERLPGTELEAKARHRLERYGREPRVSDPLLGHFPTGHTLALRQTALSAGVCPYRLPDVDVRKFAEQLTRMDVVRTLTRIIYLIKVFTFDHMTQKNYINEWVKTITI